MCCARGMYCLFASLFWEREEHDGKAVNIAARSQLPQEGWLARLSGRRISTDPSSVRLRGNLIASSTSLRYPETLFGCWVQEGDQKSISGLGEKYPLQLYTFSLSNFWELRYTNRRGIWVRRVAKGRESSTVSRSFPTISN